jgi:hypothetical protein
MGSKTPESGKYGKIMENLRSLGVTPTDDLTGLFSEFATNTGDAQVKALNDLLGSSSFRMMLTAIQSQYRTAAMQKLLEQIAELSDLNNLTSKDAWPKFLAASSKCASALQMIQGGEKSNKKETLIKAIMTRMASVLSESPLVSDLNEGLLKTMDEVSSVISADGNISLNSEKVEKTMQKVAEKINDFRKSEQVGAALKFGGEGSEATVTMSELPPERINEHMNVLTGVAVETATMQQLKNEGVADAADTDGGDSAARASASVARPIRKAAERKEDGTVEPAIEPVQARQSSKGRVKKLRKLFSDMLDAALRSFGIVTYHVGSGGHTAKGASTEDTKALFASLKKHMPSTSGMSQVYKEKHKDGVKFVIHNVKGDMSPYTYTSDVKKANIMTDKQMLEAVSSTSLMFVGSSLLMGPNDNDVIPIVPSVSREGSDRLGFRAVQLYHTMDPAMQEAHSRHASSQLTNMTDFLDMSALPARADTLLEEVSAGAHCDDVDDAASTSSSSSSDSSSDSDSEDDDDFDMDDADAGADGVDVGAGAGSTNWLMDMCAGSDSKVVRRKARKMKARHSAPARTSRARAAAKQKEKERAEAREQKIKEDARDFTRASRAIQHVSEMDSDMRKAYRELLEEYNVALTKGTGRLDKMSAELEELWKTYGNIKVRATRAGRTVGMDQKVRELLLQWNSRGQGMDDETVYNIAMHSLMPSIFGRISSDEPWRGRGPARETWAGDIAKLLIPETLVTGEGTKNTVEAPFEEMWTYTPTRTTAWKPSDIQALQKKVRDGFGLTARERVAMDVWGAIAKKKDGKVKEVTATNRKMLLLEGFMFVHSTLKVEGTVFNGHKPYTRKVADLDIIAFPMNVKHGQNKTWWQWKFQKDEILPMKDIPLSPTMVRQKEGETSVFLGPDKKGYDSSTHSKALRWGSSALGFKAEEVFLPVGRVTTQDIPRSQALLLMLGLQGNHVTGEDEATRWMFAPVHATPLREAASSLARDWSSMTRHAAGLANSLVEVRPNVVDSEALRRRVKRLVAERIGELTNFVGTSVYGRVQQSALGVDPGKEPRTLWFGQVYLPEDMANLTVELEYGPRDGKKRTKIMTMKAAFQAYSEGRPVKFEGDAEAADESVEVPWKLEPTISDGDSAPGFAKYTAATTRSWPQNIFTYGSKKNFNASPPGENAKNEGWSFIGEMLYGLASTGAVAMQLQMQQLDQAFRTLYVKYKSGTLKPGKDGANISFGSIKPVLNVLWVLYEKIIMHLGVTEEQRQKKGEWMKVPLSKSLFELPDLTGDATVYTFLYNGQLARFFRKREGGYLRPIPASTGLAKKTAGMWLEDLKANMRGRSSAPFFDGITIDSLLFEMTGAAPGLNIVNDGDVKTESAYQTALRRLADNFSSCSNVCKLSQGSIPDAEEPILEALDACENNKTIDDAKRKALQEWFRNAGSDKMTAAKYIVAINRQSTKFDAKKFAQTYSPFIHPSTIDFKMEELLPSNVSSKGVTAKMELLNVLDDDDVVKMKPTSCEQQVWEIMTGTSPPPGPGPGPGPGPDADEEARKKAEAEAAEEARRQAEAEAAEEARKQAEAEAAAAAQKKAEEEARRQADAEAAEEARRQADAEEGRVAEDPGDVFGGGGEGDTTHGAGEGRVAEDPGDVFG